MKALRILIVEDDALIGMLLAEMLEDMGHGLCAIEATEADAVTAVIRCRLTPSTRSASAPVFRIWAISPKN